MQRLLVLIVTVVAAACSTPVDAGITHESWQFGGEAPEAVAADLPDGGDVVVSLEDDRRTVVMVSFPGERLADLVAFYDRRLVDSSRSEYSIIAETEAIWTVKWERSDLEVRVQQCMDVFTRQFSLACVAIDRH